jgi:hypothetical protein
MRRRIRGWTQLWRSQGNVGHHRPANLPSPSRTMTLSKRLLGDIQAAYSAEDLSAVRAKVTPEMLSYFSEQLAGNASRGLINRVTDVQLLQGDLAEAWREDDTDYATVAMNFAQGQHASGRHRRRRRAERGHRIVDLDARAWRQFGCSAPSSRLDGRQFVCRAGKWHSPRSGCATSIGSCPSVNIEPRYNIAPEAVSAASGC